MLFAEFQFIPIFHLQVMHDYVHSRTQEFLGKLLVGGMGMCRGHDPLFSGQSALPSLPISLQYAVHVPPHFQILEIFAFSTLFLAETSALKRQNF